jgi:YVTN family beta-propeller protein
MSVPSRSFGFIAALVTATLFGLPGAAWAQERAASSKPLRRLHEPVGVLCADQGKTILVANHRSGSLSVIDAASRAVVAEHEIGRGLADFALLNDGRRLLVVDQTSNELILIEYHDRIVRVLDRLAISPDPIRLELLADDAACAVASRWSRSLTFVSLKDRTASDQSKLTLLGHLDLPFCPREIVRAPDGSKLVVADGFGGHLAVVDSARRVVERLRTIPAHNIRGIAFALDGRSLVISHQYLDPLAHTTFDDVHWGLLIRNHLRVLRSGVLFNAGSDSELLDSGRLFDLGDVGYAAGDPGAIAFDKNGNLIVALSGMDEVAITASPDEAPRRTAVGEHPVAVVPNPDGSLAYVADRLSDTISVVEIKTGMRSATIALGPALEPTIAQQGERLFYSARLSHDGWMSCHSCHSDGHTNNLISDTLGDGSYGAPKRVPSLLGVAATGPWTWTASIDRLDDQVRKSIATTMHGTKPADSQLAQLTAYLATLSPPRARDTHRARSDPPEVSRGRAIFADRKCAACHIAPEYTSAERYDVGLKDNVGNHEFNPPSLRGASIRDSFFHDGRARSLEEVFEKEKHPRRLVLSHQEITDLVSFLKTL